MNRRDIIVVAVLINVGLLVTLFVGALKNDKETNLVTNQPFQEEVSVGQSGAAIPSNGSDQVDQVLSHYSEKTKEKKEELLPLPILTPTKKETTTTPFKAPLNNQNQLVMVAKGDVLEKIARVHGVSVEDIMKLNNLSNTCLQIGQELKLPKKVAVVKEKTIPNDGKKYYIVKKGDNPWTIAQENHMKFEELLRLNDINEEKAKRLHPGDRLRVK